MPQMSADSAGVSVGVKLEPKDRLEYCAASTGNHLIFSVAWYKINPETLKSGSPQRVGSTPRAYDECPYHSTQQPMAAPRSYYTHCPLLFQGRKHGK